MLKMSALKFFVETKNQIITLKQKLFNLFEKIMYLFDGKKRLDWQITAKITTATRAPSNWMNDLPMGFLNVRPILTNTQVLLKRADSYSL